MRRSIDYEMKGMGKLLKLYGAAAEETEEEYERLEDEYEKLKKQQNREKSKHMKERITRRKFILEQRLNELNNRLGLIFGGVKDAIGYAGKSVTNRRSSSLESKRFEDFMKYLKEGSKRDSMSDETLSREQNLNKSNIIKNVFNRGKSKGKDKTDKTYKTESSDMSSIVSSSDM